MKVGLANNYNKDNNNDLGEKLSKGPKKYVSNLLDERLIHRDLQSMENIRCLIKIINDSKVRLFVNEFIIMDWYMAEKQLFLSSADLQKNVNFIDGTVPNNPNKCFVSENISSMSTNSEDMFDGYFYRFLLSKTTDIIIDMLSNNQSLLFPCKQFLNNTAFSNESKFPVMDKGYQNISLNILKEQSYYLRYLNGISVEKAKEKEEGKIESNDQKRDVLLNIGNNNRLVICHTPAHIQANILEKVTLGDLLRVLACLSKEDIDSSILPIEFPDNFSDIKKISIDSGFEAEKKIISVFKEEKENNHSDILMQENRKGDKCKITSSDIDKEMLNNENSSRIVNLSSSLRNDEHNNQSKHSSDIVKESLSNSKEINHSINKTSVSKESSFVSVISHLSIENSQSFTKEFDKNDSIKGCKLKEKICNSIHNLCEKHITLSTALVSLRMEEINDIVYLLYFTNPFNIFLSYLIDILFVLDEVAIQSNFESELSLLSYESETLYNEINPSQCWNEAIMDEYNYRKNTNEKLASEEESRESSKILAMYSSIIISNRMYLERNEYVDKKESLISDKENGKNEKSNILSNHNLVNSECRENSISNKLLTNNSSVTSSFHSFVLNNTLNSSLSSNHSFHPVNSSIQSILNHNFISNQNEDIKDSFDSSKFLLNDDSLLLRILHKLILPSSKELMTQRAVLKSYVLFIKEQSLAKDMNNLSLKINSEVYKRNNGKNNFIRNIKEESKLKKIKKHRLQKLFYIPSTLKTSDKTISFPKFIVDYSFITDKYNSLQQIVKELVNKEIIQERKEKNPKESLFEDVNNEEKLSDEKDKVNSTVNEDLSNEEENRILLKNTINSKDFDLITKSTKDNLRENISNIDSQSTYSDRSNRIDVPFIVLHSLFFKDKQKQEIINHSFNVLSVIHSSPSNSYYSNNNSFYSSSSSSSSSLINFPSHSVSNDSYSLSNNHSFSSSSLLSAHNLSNSNENSNYSKSIYSLSNIAKIISENRFSSKIESPSYAKDSHHLQSNSHSLNPSSSKTQSIFTSKSSIHPHPPPQNIHHTFSSVQESNLFLSVFSNSLNKQDNNKAVLSKLSVEEMQSLQKQREETEIVMEAFLKRKMNEIKKDMNRNRRYSKKNINKLRKEESFSDTSEEYNKRNALIIDDSEDSLKLKRERIIHKNKKIINRNMDKQRRTYDNSFNNNETLFKSLETETGDLNSSKETKRSIKDSEGLEYSAEVNNERDYVKNNLNNNNIYPSKVHSKKGRKNKNSFHQMNDEVTISLESDIKNKEEESDDIDSDSNEKHIQLNSLKSKKLLRELKGLIIPSVNSQEKNKREHGILRKGFQEESSKKKILMKDSNQNQLSDDKVKKSNVDGDSVKSFQHLLTENKKENSLLRKNTLHKKFKKNDINLKDKSINTETDEVDKIQSSKKSEYNSFSSDNLSGENMMVKKELMSNGKIARLHRIMMPRWKTQLGLGFKDYKKELPSGYMDNHQKFPEENDINKEDKEKNLKSLDLRNKRIIRNEVIGKRHYRKRMKKNEMEMENDDNGDDSLSWLSSRSNSGCENSDSSDIFEDSGKENNLKKMMDNLNFSYKYRNKKLEERIKIEELHKKDAEKEFVFTHFKNYFGFHFLTTPPIVNRNAYLGKNMKTFSPFFNNIQYKNGQQMMFKNSLSLSDLTNSSLFLNRFNNIRKENVENVNDNTKGLITFSNGNVEKNLNMNNSISSEEEKVEKKKIDYNNFMLKNRYHKRFIFRKISGNKDENLNKRVDNFTTNEDEYPSTINSQDTFLYNKNFGKNVNNLNNFHDKFKRGKNDFTVEYNLHSMSSSVYRDNIEVEENNNEEYLNKEYYENYSDSSDVYDEFNLPRHGDDIAYPKSSKIISCEPPSISNYPVRSERSLINDYYLNQSNSNVVRFNNYRNRKNINHIHSLKHRSDKLLLLSSDRQNSGLNNNEESHILGDKSRSPSPSCSTRSNSPSPKIWGNPSVMPMEIYSTNIELKREKMSNKVETESELSSPVNSLTSPSFQSMNHLQSIQDITSNNTLNLSNRYKEQLKPVENDSEFNKILTIAPDSHSSYLPLKVSESILSPEVDSLSEDVPFRSFSRRLKDYVLKKSSSKVEDPFIKTIHSVDVCKGPLLNTNFSLNTPKSFTSSDFSYFANISEDYLVRHYTTSLVDPLPYFVLERTFSEEDGKGEEMSMRQLRSMPHRFITVSQMHFLIHLHSQQKPPLSNWAPFDLRRKLTYSKSFKDYSIPSGFSYSSNMLRSSIGVRSGQFVDLRINSSERKRSINARSSLWARVNKNRKRLRGKNLIGDEKESLRSMYIRKERLGRKKRMIRVPKRYSELEYYEGNYFKNSKYSINEDNSENEAIEEDNADSESKEKEKKKKNNFQNKIDDEEENINEEENDRLKEDSYEEKSDSDEMNRTNMSNVIRNKRLAKRNKENESISEGQNDDDDYVVEEKDTEKGLDFEKRKKVSDVISNRTRNLRMKYLLDKGLTYKTSPNDGFLNKDDIFVYGQGKFPLNKVDNSERIKEKKNNQNQSHEEKQTEFFELYNTDRKVPNIVDSNVHLRITKLLPRDSQSNLRIRNAVLLTNIILKSIDGTTRDLVNSLISTLKLPSFFSEHILLLFHHTNVIQNSFPESSETSAVIDCCEPNKCHMSEDYIYLPYSEKLVSSISRNEDFNNNQKTLHNYLNTNNSDQYYSRLLKTEWGRNKDKEPLMAHVIIKGSDLNEEVERLLLTKRCLEWNDKLSLFEREKDRKEEGSVIKKKKMSNDVSVLNPTSLNSSSNRSSESNKFNGLYKNDLNNNGDFLVNKNSNSIHKEIDKKNVLAIEKKLLNKNLSKEELISFFNKYEIQTSSFATASNNPGEKQCKLFSFVYRDEEFPSPFKRLNTDELSEKYLFDRNLTAPSLSYTQGLFVDIMIGTACSYEEKNIESVMNICRDIDIPYSFQSLITSLLYVCSYVICVMHMRISNPLNLSADDDKEHISELKTLFHCMFKMQSINNKSDDNTGSMSLSKESIKEESNIKRMKRSSKRKIEQARKHSEYYSNRSCCIISQFSFTQFFKTLFFENPGLFTDIVNSKELFSSKDIINFIFSPLVVESFVYALAIIIQPVFANNLFFTFLPQQISGTDSSSTTDDSEIPVADISSKSNIKNELEQKESNLDNEFFNKKSKEIKNKGEKIHMFGLTRLGQSLIRLVTLCILLQTFAQENKKTNYSYTSNSVSSNDNKDKNSSDITMKNVKAASSSNISGNGSYSSNTSSNSSNSSSFIDVENDLNSSVSNLYDLMRIPLFTYLNDPDYFLFCFSLAEQFIYCPYVQNLIYSSVNSPRIISGDLISDSYNLFSLDIFSPPLWSFVEFEKPIHLSSLYASLNSISTVFSRESGFISSLISLPLISHVYMLNLKDLSHPVTPFTTRDFRKGELREDSFYSTIETEDLPYQPFYSLINERIIAIIELCLASAVILTSCLKKTPIVKKTSSSKDSCNNMSESSNIFRKRLDFLCKGNKSQCKLLLDFLLDAVCSINIALPQFFFLQAPEELILNAKEHKESLEKEFFEVFHPTASDKNSTIFSVENLQQYMRDDIEKERSKNLELKKNLNDVLEDLDGISSKRKDVQNNINDISSLSIDAISPEYIDTSKDKVEVLSKSNISNESANRLSSIDSYKFPMFMVFYLLRLSNIVNQQISEHKESMLNVNASDVNLNHSTKLDGNEDELYSKDENVEEKKYSFQRIIHTHDFQSYRHFYGELRNRIGNEALILTQEETNKVWSSYYTALVRMSSVPHLRPSHQPLFHPPRKFQNPAYARSLLKKINSSNILYCSKIVRFLYECNPIYKDIWVDVTPESERNNLLKATNIRKVQRISKVRSRNGDKSDRLSSDKFGRNMNRLNKQTSSNEADTHSLSIQDKRDFLFPDSRVKINPDAFSRLMPLTKAFPYPPTENIIGDPFMNIPSTISMNQTPTINYQDGKTNYSKIVEPSSYIPKFVPNPPYNMVLNNNLKQNFQNNKDMLTSGVQNLYLLPQPPMNLNKNNTSLTPDKPSLSPNYNSYNNQNNSFNTDNLSRMKTFGGNINENSNVTLINNNSQNNTFNFPPQKSYNLLNKSNITYNNSINNGIPISNSQETKSVEKVTSQINKNMIISSQEFLKIYDERTNNLNYISDIDRNKENLNDLKNMRSNIAEVNKNNHNSNVQPFPFGIIRGSSISSYVIPKELKSNENVACMTQVSSNFLQEHNLAMGYTHNSYNNLKSNILNDLQFDQVTGKYSVKPDSLFPVQPPFSSSSSSYNSLTTSEVVRRIDDKQEKPNSF